MRLWHGFVLALVGAAVTSSVVAAPAQTTSTFETLAITYREGQGSTVDMVGTALKPGLLGEADVKRNQGRTKVKLRFEEPLPHPQSLGSLYTAYVLWAVAPEGRAENLAELPHSKAFYVDATTSLGAFGLIVTAEPHGAVLQPGPRLVAQNAARPDTKGRVQAGSVSYATADQALALVESGRPDYTTPLLLLGARRAVEIARAADAGEYAEAQLREAEVKLTALEHMVGDDRKLSKDEQTMSREVMRLAENARSLSAERQAAAALSDERKAASAALSRAQTEAERAREHAAQALDEAASYREAMERAEREAAEARQRVQSAQTDAERARADEELARAEAEQARLQAEDARRQAQQAQQDTQQMQERLYQSLSAILETRREARGLIVSLSDVLFDFNKATLRPGAREKLSKLTGILLAYPGSYRIEIEGHTDSIGSDQYNLQLSQDRGDSVGLFLMQAGIPRDHLGRVTGFGESRPVTSNMTAAGRQMNRRVEIVITDLDTRVSGR